MTLGDELVASIIVSNEDRPNDNAIGTPINIKTKNEPKRMAIVMKFHPPLVDYLDL